MQEATVAVLEANFSMEHRGASIWWADVAPRPRVLIIDDDRALSNLVSYVMRHEGFEVDTVNDGDSGIRLAVDGSYDAVVLCSGSCATMACGCRS
jgi:hypothetical protein